MSLEAPQPPCVSDYLYVHCLFEYIYVHVFFVNSFARSMCFGLHLHSIGQDQNNQQLVQNTVAKLSTGVCKHGHICLAHVSLVTLN